MNPFTKIAMILTLSALCGCLSGGGLETASLGGVAALEGGLIGRDPETKGLPSRARASALSAEFRALQFTPAGETVAWETENYRGVVEPTQLYRIGSQDCRGYTHTVIMESGPVKTIGTACKTEEGFWRPVV